MAKFYVNIQLSHSLYKVCKEDVKQVHYLKKLKRRALPAFHSAQKYQEIEPVTDCAVLEIEEEEGVGLGCPLDLC
jgi:hypothetical protein